MVECSGLLNRRAVKGSMSSNLISSALRSTSFVRQVATNFFWRDVRVVYGNSLLRSRGVKPTAGSNPVPSANPLRKKIFF